MQDYRRGNSRMDTSFCELEVYRVFHDLWTLL